MPVEMKPDFSYNKIIKTGFQHGLPEGCTLLIVPYQALQDPNLHLIKRFAYAASTLFFNTAAPILPNACSVHK